MEGDATNTATIEAPAAPAAPPAGAGAAVSPAQPTSTGTAAAAAAPTDGAAPKPVQLSADEQREVAHKKFFADRAKIEKEDEDKRIAALDNEDGDANTTNDEGDDTTRKPAQADNSAAAISPADETLLKRWQMTPEDFKELTPAAQTKLLAGLRSRTEWFDGEVGKLGQRKQQQESPAVQPGKEGQAADNGNAAPDEPDDAWNPVEEYWTPEGAAPLKRAVAAHVDRAMKQHVEPARAEIAALQGYLATTQVESALAALKLPPGVDLRDPAVEKQLLEAAAADLQGRFDWRTNNWKHAIQRAAGVLFNQQAIAAGKTQRNELAQQRAKGSVESGNRPAPPTTELTDDQRHQIAYEGTKKGLRGEGLTRYVETAGFRR